MADKPVPGDQAEPRTPPYPGSGAFASLIDRLAKDGVPAVVDRGFIGGSGSNQSSISAALKFLGLVDEDGKPTHDLHDLAEKEDERPAIYRRLVERHYTGALELGPRATQTQLEQWFRQQGVSGDTARKAQGFFLALAKQAGLELSPYFKVSRSSPPAKRRSTPRKRANGGQAQPPTVDKDPARQQGQIHPAVMHLLDKIPPPGEPWTREEKELLVRTFDNLLDLFHPVQDSTREEAVET